MKPLCTITTKAVSPEQGICGILEQVNYSFKDEEMRYVDTVCMPVMEPPSLAYPRGNMVFSVCMIFEGKDFEQIARVNELLIKSGQTKIPIITKETPNGN